MSRQDREQSVRERLTATLAGETATMLDLASITPADLDKLADDYINDKPGVDLLFLRLRSIRGQARIADTLLRMVRNNAERKLADKRDTVLSDIAGQLAGQKLTACLPLPQHLGDLSEVTVPRGYEVSLSGVFRLRPSLDHSGEPRRDTLARSPLIPVRLDTDILNGRSHVVLAWLDASGRWRTARLPRKQALEPRGLHSLADHGAPVNLNSSVRLVDWVSDFEARNRTTLPRRTTASRMGWFALQDEAPGFLVGNTYLSDTDTPMGLVPPTNYEEHSRAWGTSGSGEAWVEGLVPLRDKPLAMLAIYAALAAPLLSIIDAPCFVVDWSGETSGGKTTVLSLGMSVFGHPTQGLLSWEDTPTHIERVAAYLHHLPLVVDDTKRAQGPAKLAKTVYQFSQGKGKGRGHIEGLQQTPRWRSVMLSSGEAPIVSYGQDGGSRARAVLLRGRPLGYDDEAGRELVAHINSTIAENYGHAGQAFVTKLLQNKQQWSELKKTYNQRVARVASLLGGRVEGRVAQYIAALDTAGALFHGLRIGGARFPPPPPQYDPIDHAIGEVSKFASTSAYDLPFEALEYVVGWVAVNEARFFGRAAYHSGQPPGGWVGAWDSGNDWEFIAIIPSILNDVLRRQGYHPPEIIERWTERGFLVKEQRQQKVKVTIGSTRPRCYAIAREALDKLL